MSFAYYLRRRGSAEVLVMTETEIEAFITRWGGGVSRGGKQSMVTLMETRRDAG